jgi:hypothetical protein
MFGRENNLRLIAVIAGPRSISMVFATVFLPGYRNFQLPCWVYDFESVFVVLFFIEINVIRSEFSPTWKSDSYSLGLNGENLLSLDYY